MLISEATEEKVNLLIQAMFNHNRSWDRFMAVAQVDWAMDNFTKVFHDGLAHIYLGLVDLLGDILLRYNIAPKYYETKRDTRTYSGMLDFFETNLNEHIETYELIKSAIQTATDNGDFNVEADLKQFLRIWNKFMNQAILLRDKAQVYGEENKAMFDGFAEQFYALEDEYEMLTGNKYKED